jgi:hypothetical protein
MVQIQHSNSRSVCNRASALGLTVTNQCNGQRIEAIGAETGRSVLIAFAGAARGDWFSDRV